MSSITALIVVAAAGAVFAAVGIYAVIRQAEWIKDKDTEK